MMLASTDCRVALVTTHLPLAEGPQDHYPKRIETVTGIVIKAFSDVFQMPQPRIHVLGLNPHAGEDGHLGREELDVIKPALEARRAQNPNVHIEGPLPADTAFTPELRAQADRHIAMYHDQALPVVKYRGFRDSVNITTLGLQSFEPVLITARLLVWLARIGKYQKRPRHRDPRSESLNNIVRLKNS